MVKNEFTSEQNKYTTRSIKISFFLNAKIKQLMHQSHETTQEDYKSFGKVWNQKNDTDIQLTNKTGKYKFVSVPT